MASLKYKNPDTGAWEKVAGGGGGGASTADKITVPSTTCNALALPSNSSVDTALLKLKYTYGTEDLEAGVTPLETGKLHFVYE